MRDSALAFFGPGQRICLFIASICYIDVFMCCKIDDEIRIRKQCDLTSEMQQKPMEGMDKK